MKKGFTLIELLITLTVIGILMSTLSTIFANGIKQLNNELAITKIQSEAQTVIDRINSEIKQAAGTVNQIDDKTLSDTTLILKMPAIDADRNVIYSEGNIIYDQIIYYSQAGSLHRKTIANPQSIRYTDNGIDKSILSNLSQIIFSYYPDMASPVGVNTSFVLQRKVGKEVKSISVSGSARFRNNL